MIESSAIPFTGLLISSFDRKFIVIILIKDVFVKIKIREGCYIANFPFSLGEWRDAVFIAAICSMIMKISSMTHHSEPTLRIYFCFNHNLGTVLFPKGLIAFKWVLPGMIWLDEVILNPITSHIFVPGRTRLHF